MKVSELVAELMKLNQDLPIEICIGAAKDSAWTKAEIGLEVKADAAQISGWVSSDDEDAWFPGE